MPDIFIPGNVKVDSVKLASLITDALEAYLDAPPTRPGPPPDVGPRVDLPAYMSNPHTSHVFRATREWTEVFPGVQACLVSFKGEAEARIDFRLTPPGAS